MKKIYLIVAAISFLSGCAIQEKSIDANNLSGQWKINLGLNLKREKSMSAKGVLRTDSNGEYHWKLMGSVLNDCDMAIDKTEVKKEGDILIIETTSSIKDCAQYKYKINSDGSGLVYFKKDGDAWIKSARKIEGFY